MHLKNYSHSLIFGLLSILFYLSFGYALERTDYIKLFTLYAALFFLYYNLLKFHSHNLRYLAILAFAFRMVFLLATPNLSQDFYRFIWDGRLILEGVDPYLHTPESLMSSARYPVHQAQELFKGMGVLSGSHLSNYPPLNQFCFILAGLFAGKSIMGSIIVMRLIIIAADFGILYFGKKLLEKCNLPVHSIFGYMLNPFIIIELTGNLHFEGVMIFFLIWSLYLLHIGKWKLAAIVWACSISVKLIPLLFLPVFIKNLQWKKTLIFYMLVGLTTILLFAPFYSNEFFTNYFHTVALWFQEFEFNASIYYMARKLGYAITGYNQIGTIGKAIAVVNIIFVVSMAFFRKNKTTKDVMVSMLLVLSVYYFTSTTVHPWYLATLVIVSVFTPYKFALVWSFTVALSYLAYNNLNNAENLWVIGAEYVCVYSIFVWEVFFKKKSMISAS